MLNQENSLVLMIDIQEKLTSMLKENCEIAKEKARKIISAAKILNIKTIVTEQYPKGLGQTIKGLQEILKENYKPFEKTYFSAANENSILEEIKNSNKNQIVIFGIEAHICVFQTAIKLKEMGYEVYVIEDASFSRDYKEKELAMKNLLNLGIFNLSVESVLFMWLKGSKHPNFKEVQALIK